MNKNEISLEFVNKPIERASNENVYGLLTSGKIIKVGDEYKVVSVVF